MNIKQKLSILAVGFLLVNCTGENVIETPTPDGSGTDDDIARREVQLTLKNKLSLASAKTKAGDTPIATAEENYLQSLDVYVFGSDTEDGTYTFQELYYYRDDASTATGDGDWAHSFNITPVAGKDNLNNGLLRLKKGLYIKLYCVANRTKLYQTTDDGTVIAYENFAPLKQSAPGQPGNKVTAGVPSEEDFLKLHSQVINPTGASEDDILQTPLPMTGSYVTPLDLTDFSVSTRTQLNFKLSRMVARFDVTNNAEASKFTIETISMGKGQPGAWFFPIKTLIDVSDDLITYPKREMLADKQTEAAPTTTGAFYSWPSPKADEGFLILTGKYAVNKTEQKEVTYQIPFQQIQNGVGSYIEVAYNHRYTIAITKADDYHLDFTLNVQDWDDGGSIDDYEPENNFDKDMKIVLTADATTTNAYVQENGTISIAPEDGSKLAFKIGSNTELTEKLIYKTGSAEWLIADPTTRSVTKATAPLEKLYTYKVDETKLSGQGKILPVTIRLTNPASGEHKDIVVKPQAGPEISWTAAAGNYNTFDAESLTATLYNATGQTILLKVTADTKVEGQTTTTGSSAAIADAPAWLSIDPANSDQAVADYTLTVGSGGDNNGTATVNFTPTVNNKTTAVTVQLKDPAMKALEESNFKTGSLNTLDMTGGEGSIPKVTLLAKSGNSFVVTVISPEGITAEATTGSDWFSVEAKAGTATDDGNKQIIITATISNISEAKTGGKITITNVLDPTKTQVIEVASELPAGPTVSMVTVSGNLSTYDSGSSTATLYNAVGQTIKLQTNEATTVSTSTSWLTVDSEKKTDHVITVKTAEGAGSNGSITFTNDNGGKTTVNVTLKEVAITALADGNFSSKTGSNSFTAAGSGNAKVTMTDAKENDQFTLTVTSPEGITANSSNNWLTIDTGEKSGSAGSYTNVITVTINNNFSTSQNGTITLANAISGGGDMTIDIEANAPTGGGGI